MTIQNRLNNYIINNNSNNFFSSKEPFEVGSQKLSSNLNTTEFGNAIFKGINYEKSIDNFDDDSIPDDSILNLTFDEINKKASKAVYKEAAYILLNSIPMNLNSDHISTLLNSGVYEFPYAYILYLGSLYYRYKYGMEFDNDYFNDNKLSIDNIKINDIFNTIGENDGDQSIFNTVSINDSKRIQTFSGIGSRPRKVEKTSAIDPSQIMYKEPYNFFISGYGVYSNYIKNWDYFLYHENDEFNNFSYFINKVNNNYLNVFKSQEYNNDINVNFYGLYNLVNYQSGEVDFSKYKDKSLFELYSVLKRFIKNKLANKNSIDEIKNSFDENRNDLDKKTIKDFINDKLVENGIDITTLIEEFLKPVNLSNNQNVYSIDYFINVLIEKVNKHYNYNLTETYKNENFYNTQLLMHLYPSALGIFNPSSLLSNYNSVELSEETKKNIDLKDNFSSDLNNLVFEGNAKNIVNNSVRFISYSGPFMDDKLLLPNSDEVNIIENNNFTKLGPFFNVFPESFLQVCMDEFLKFSTPSISSLVYNSTFNFKLLLRSLMTITYDDLSNVDLTNRNGVTAEEQKLILIGYDSYVSERALDEFGNNIVEKDINVILTNAQLNRSKKVISEFLDETVIINNQSVFEYSVTENNFNNISNVLFDENLFFYNDLNNIPLSNKERINKIIFNNYNKPQNNVELETELNKFSKLLNHYYGDIDASLLGVVNLRDRYIEEWERRKAATDDPDREEVINEVINIFSRNQSVSLIGTSLAFSTSEVISNRIPGFSSEDFNGAAGVPNDFIQSNLSDIINMVNIVEKLFRKLEVLPREDLIKISKPFVDYFISLFFKNFDNDFVVSIYEEHQKTINNKIESIIEDVVQNKKNEEVTLINYLETVNPFVSIFNEFVDEQTYIQFFLGLKIQETFANNKLSDEIDNFNVEKAINETFDSSINLFHDNLLNILKKGKKGLNTYLEGFSDELERYLEGRKRKDEKDESKDTGSVSSEDIRFKTYYNMKSIYDSWISFVDEENKDSNGNIKLAYNFNKVPDCVGVFDNSEAGDDKDLIDYFFIVDRGGRNIGRDTMVDLNFVVDYFGENLDSSNLNTSFHSFLDTLLDEHGFRFHALPAYIDFGSYDQETISKTFGVFDELLTIGTSPAYLCQYLGDASSKPFSERNNNIDTVGKSFCLDDDAESVDLPSDMKNGTATSFIVDFGVNEQQIFYNMELDQSEFMDTEESLDVITNMTKNYADTAGSNLYKVYTSRSYTCQVESLGNMMIQPLMFFYLKNVPIFEGTYWITNLKHNIVGNNMNTTFKGVRQPQSVLPSPNEVLISLNEDFVKSFGVKSKLENVAGDEEFFSKNRGDLNDYLLAIADKESGGNGDWEAINDLGFIGRYQFGMATIDTLVQNYSIIIQKALNSETNQGNISEWFRTDDYNIKNIDKNKNVPVNGALTIDKWRNYSTSERRDVFPPKIQNLLMVLNLRYNLNLLNTILNKSIDKLEGKTINGVPITKSGLLAGAHLGGSENVIKFIEKGVVTEDANETSVTDYIRKFGGYRLNNLEDDENNRPFELNSNA